MKVNSLGYSLKDVLPSVSLKNYITVLADNKINDPDTYKTLGPILFLCVFYTSRECFGLGYIVSRFWLKRLL